MEDLRDLYQDVILDHNKNPRNFQILNDADRKVDGLNPLCGDHYTIYVNMDGDVISEVTYAGAGCAISKASASIMSTVVKGKTVDEAEELFNIFHKIVTGEVDAAKYIDKIGKLAVFAGVAEFPVRVKCATLAWHAMHKAIKGEEEKVSTE